MLSGCGYTASVGVLPQHLKTVAVPVFENQTSEYTLEQQVTEAVIRRFVTDSRLRVVDERSADCAVIGKITEYRNSVFGVSNADLAQEYRVTIGVSVVFRDQVKNRELWHDDNIVKTANYYVQTVPGQQATTELDGRQNAILKIADEILARTVQSW